MIILTIPFTIIFVILTMKYFSIRKKIKTKYIPPEEDESYRNDFAKIIIKIRKGIFDYCQDSCDTLFTKEEMFKSHILKNFILRGFYNEFSLKQILEIYNILKSECRDNLCDDFWIEPWAQDILKDIRNNLNVFTFIMYRYKIGRAILVIFSNLDIISRNFCIVKDFYDNKLDFIKDIPRQISYILDAIKSRKDMQVYFINFYEINDPDVWYRKEWI